MPIQVNPLAIGGLAGLASRGTPNLNLQPAIYGTPLYGENILKGAIAGAQLQQNQNSLYAQMQMQQYAQAQENARNAATLQNTAAIAQAGQQNQMKIAQMQNQLGQGQLAQQTAYQQGQLGLQGKQLAQTGEYQQGQLGLGQQQVDVSKQNANTQQQMLQIEAMKALQPLQLAKLGASNATLLMGMSQYGNDPQKLQEFIQHQTQLDLKNGLISPQEAASRLQMNPQDLLSTAVQNMMITGIAGGKANPAMAGIMPPMGNIYGNLPMEKPTSEEANKTVANTGKAQINLSSTLANFDPDLFSYKGQATAEGGQVLGNSPQIVQKTWDSIANMTGLPNTQQANDLHTAASAFKSNTLKNIMDILQQQPGVRFNERTIAAIEPAIPTVGKDTAESAFAKTANLYTQSKTVGEYEANLIKQGIPADSEKFNQLVAKHITDSTASGKLSYTGQNGQKTQVGFKQIEEFASQHGIPVNQAIQYVLQHP